MNNREDKTLTLAAALDPSKRGRNRISPDSGLIEQAVREGVAGILYKSLLTSGALGSLDQGDKETLKTFYYQTTRMNLLLMHALKQVLSQVNQRGIAVVVLQGMALLNLYGFHSPQRAACCHSREGGNPDRDIISGHPPARV